MKILRAIGFGLLIIVLKFMVPKIFSGLENTLLSFLDVLDSILVKSKESMSAGAIQWK